MGVYGTHHACSMCLCPLCAPLCIGGLFPHWPGHVFPMPLLHYSSLLHGAPASRSCTHCCAGYGIYMAILLHCHVLGGGKVHPAFPWPAAAHLWALCMYSIWCAADSSLRASCLINAAPHAHGASTHGFAHPLNTLYAAGLL